MKRRKQWTILSVLIYCAFFDPSQAAPIAGIANASRAAPVTVQIGCCRYHHRYYSHRLRWYWRPEPYNRHFDLYYGWLAAH
jgi:hypothetical protein